MLIANDRSARNETNRYMDRILRSTSAGGYIVKKRYFQTLLANFKESVEIMEHELDAHIEKCKKEHTRN
jgi:hypothetical protein